MNEVVEATDYVHQTKAIVLSQKGLLQQKDQITNKTWQSTIEQITTFYSYYGEDFIIIFKFVYRFISLSFFSVLTKVVKMVSY